MFPNVQTSPLWWRLSLHGVAIRKAIIRSHGGAAAFASMTAELWGLPRNAPASPTQLTWVVVGLRTRDWSRDGSDARQEKEDSVESMRGDLICRNHVFDVSVRYQRAQPAQIQRRSQKFQGRFFSPFHGGPQAWARGHLLGCPNLSPLEKLYSVCRALVITAKRSVDELFMH